MRVTVARVPCRRGEVPIEPMEDVEGAENNLGLDDIPQGLGSGMDLVGWTWRTKLVEGHG